MSMSFLWWLNDKISKPSIKSDKSFEHILLSQIKKVNGAASSNIVTGLVKEESVLWGYKKKKRRGAS